MNILGISSYSHEASCSLIVDGRIKFVIEQERLNREKHTCEYPAQAIKQCLALSGMTIHNVDHFAFFWVPTREISGNLGHFLKYLPQSLNLLKGGSGSAELSFLRRIFLMRNIGRRIQKQFHLKKSPKVHFIEHHLCHAASCFFVSKFETAAILTIDGRGESTSTLLAKGTDRTIEKLSEINTPHSLGHLYAALTEYLGFRPFFDEWKVMGMSAYGTNTYEKVFEDILHLLPDGSFRLNLKYFRFHTHGRGAWVSSHLTKKLGPRRNARDDYQQRHFDIAFGLQKVVEDAGVHLVRHLYNRTKLPNLCLTGGVVLNCLMNSKIIEQTPFENFFIQPIANDAGTSLGSALYTYHAVLGQQRNFRFDSVYLGPEYSNDEIESVLKKKNLIYDRSPDIANETARYVAEGKIVGWFQGRMEAGPRALGHRSIVVNPCDPTMKDRLNKRVKKREFFRPFAPSVLEEKVAEYFILPKGQLSPYMILTGAVREDKKDIIPAVTHADGTARVQTVNKVKAPRYWRLIAEFEKITNVPVVLNTSFNENEPIVCTPQDAVNCFLRTDFDVLAIGDFLVLKDKNI